MKGIIVSLGLLVSTFSMAQDFNFMGMSGGSLIYSRYYKELVHEPTQLPYASQFNAFTYGLTVGGKLLFEKRPNISYAIATYPSLTFNFAASQFGSFGVLGMNFPTYGEVILGNTQSFNFTAGLGLEYNFYKQFGFPVENIIGPSAHISGQIDINGALYIVKLAYTHGLNNGKFKEDPEYRVVGGTRNTFTASLIYPF